jgi:hypothetical protein
MLMSCANFGDLVSADLGNVVLELVDDLDPEGHVFGALLDYAYSDVLAALSTRALAPVSTSTFLEKSVVGADLSECWFLNLLVVSVLRVKCR